MSLEQYLPVLLFILVGLGVGVAPQLIGYFLGPQKPDAAKNSPYECGFEAFEDARIKFDVRYYLVAILFILFDLEIAFLFPWAVSLKDIGLTGFVAMMIFLGILVVGFVYEWKRAPSIGNKSCHLKAFSKKDSSPRPTTRWSIGPKLGHCGP